MSNSAAPGVSTETVVCQSKFRKGLAVAIAAIGAIALVWGLITNADDTWRLIAPLLLVVALVWALMWVPAVVVSPGGVDIRNPFSTVALPWPSIRSIDTRYALTLITAHGQYAAWAAPAGGRTAAMRVQRETNRSVKKGDDVETESVKVGDLHSSPSGAAAGIIRERYAELGKAGLLDNPKLERETPKVTRHWSLIGVLAGLVVATVVTAVV